MKIWKWIKNNWARGMQPNAEIDETAFLPMLGGNLTFFQIIGGTLQRVVTKTYEMISIGVNLWRLQLSISLTIVR